MKFSKLTIGPRLYLGFSLPVFLLVVIVGIALLNMGTIHEDVERIVKVNNVRAEKASEMGEWVRENSIYLRNIILTKDPETRKGEKRRIEEARAKYGEAFRKVEEMTAKDDAKGHEIIARVKGLQETARGLNNKVVELGLANRDNEALELLNKEARPAVRKWIEGTTELIKHQEARSQRRYDQSVKTYASSKAYMLTIGGIALFLAGLVSFLITRSITGPVSRVAAGLREGAEQVASASSQVASASQSLAEGASEQAAGLEETSSSIEEMTSMTRRNADNSNQANTMMAETGRVVEEANHSMKDLTQSMNEISAASEETAKIIKTIDEIAFQTNLLALNAAVEAARAGEAGAGFAVVADEVRNLAMRAAEAAKNTANMIEGTVKKIKNGSDIVSRTNEAFARVASGAQKIGGLVGEISAASNEQAQGIEQINKAVAEMDKVTQQNAACAEESAAAAQEMSAQAETMRGFVGQLAALVGGGNGREAMPVGELKKTGRPGGKLPGKFVPKASALKVGGATPEQVIPLGEGDFKQF